MAELFVANHRQYRSQMLVVSDGALVDLANLVEGAVGEFDPVVADRKPAIGVVENRYVLADRGLGRLARLKITLSYCKVSAWERRRCSFQAASFRSSPARSGRCRSFCRR